MSNCINIPPGLEPDGGWGGFHKQQMEMLKDLEMAIDRCLREVLTVYFGRYPTPEDLARVILGHDRPLHKSVSTITVVVDKKRLGYIKTNIWAPFKEKAI